MAKPTTSLLCDVALFLGGASAALLLIWAFSSLSGSLLPATLLPSGDSLLLSDPPNFYDDPTLGYTLDSPLSLWDAKRRRWLDLHPTVRPPRVLLLSGSQAGPCANPIGDHLLLRLLKNKGDYCRLQGCDLFYSTSLFHPRMPEYWSKLPALRAAMVAHPEADWLWWVDSDAVFTDMDFKLPLNRNRMEVYFNMLCGRTKQRIGSEVVASYIVIDKVRQRDKLVASSFRRD